MFEIEFVEVEENAIGARFQHGTDTIIIPICDLIKKDRVMRSMIECRDKHNSENDREGFGVIVKSGENFGVGILNTKPTFLEAVFGKKV